MKLPTRRSTTTAHERASRVNADVPAKPMTLIKSIAALSLVAVCGTAALAETFAEYFTNQVPFTRVVSENERPADSLCGMYKNGNPDTGGLSGRRLYLYPDRAFVLTRWADILPEEPVLKGTWTRTDSALTLVPQSATNLPWLDLSYTTVLFDDGRKQSLLLVGAEWGEKGFRDFAGRHEEALARARSVYVANADRPANFVFRTWEEEVMYVMTFSAGLVQKRLLTEQDSRWLTAEPLP